MLIKILKPFNYKEVKYQANQEIEIKEDATKLPAEIFWRNRLKDKDVVCLTKQEICEYYAKQNDVVNFEKHSKLFCDELESVIKHISNIEKDKITEDDKRIKKESEELLKNHKDLKERLLNEQKAINKK
jgi:hypothetical protein